MAFLKKTDVSRPITDTLGSGEAGPGGDGATAERIALDVGEPRPMLVVLEGKYNTKGDILNFLKIRSMPP